MNLRDAARQALEGLEKWQDGKDPRGADDYIATLKAALAEPVQEPVALGWLHKWANHDDGEPETQWHEGYEAARRVVQIHLTAPPQRKPLTDEEIKPLVQRAMTYYGYDPERYGLTASAGFEVLARAIERAHGIGGQDESA